MVLVIMVCVLHRSDRTLCSVIGSTVSPLPGVHIRGNPRFACLYITLHKTDLNGLRAIILVQATYPLENVIHTTSATYPQF